jgi:hypothetical protein
MACRLSPIGATISYTGQTYRPPLVHVTESVKSNRMGSGLCLDEVRGVLFVAESAMDHDTKRLPNRHLAGDFIPPWNELVQLGVAFRLSIGTFYLAQLGAFHLARQF